VWQQCNSSVLTVWHCTAASSLVTTHQPSKLRMLKHPLPPVKIWKYTWDYQSLQVWVVLKVVIMIITTANIRKFLRIIKRSQAKLEICVTVKRGRHEHAWRDVGVISRNRRVICVGGWWLSSEIECTLSWGERRESKAREKGETGLERVVRGGWGGG
jgi:hypothetical protein